jgi:hypothetical protein
MSGCSLQTLLLACITACGTACTATANPTPPPQRTPGVGLAALVRERDDLLKRRKQFVLQVAA